MPIARLDRTILSLSGEGVEGFLNGIITNNLSGDITFTALLTPQGKIIADFFVTRTDEGLLIDTPSKFGADLLKRIKMYKLRAKFDLADVSDDMSVYAAWGGNGDEGHADPRHSALGRRIITPALEVTASDDEYNAHRLALGIPDSAWDFETVTTFPADINMDLLRGVDYQKGCFVGQEVVSRMHRKGEVRKRTCGLTHDGAKAGESLWQNDVKVGQIISAFDMRGMAIIRVDKADFTQNAQTQDGVIVTLSEPAHDT